MARTPDIDRARAHCTRNRAEIASSDRCGCFYCLRVFPPGEIESEDWLPSEGTATCPHCGIDSVLGSASGFPITPEFLQRMRARWFEG